MRIATEACLGIDTSNYTTSIAVVDREGNILIDERKPLKVKQGERGLRQSDALFQHMENLPPMIEKTFPSVSNYRIVGIATSSCPRQVVGSYMPVFHAGVSFGRALAAALSIPLYSYSHQEGHLAAAAFGTSLDNEEVFLGMHLSGGTSEMLLVNQHKVEIVGKTRDISFGQVLDRIGVAMGLSFPCGQEMDRLALGLSAKPELFKAVSFSGLDLNLSGLETQAVKRWQAGDVEAPYLAKAVLDVISNALIKWVENGYAKTRCEQVLFTGGVSASEFIREAIYQQFNGKPVQVIFGQKALSSDNAVGIALMGGNAIWR